VVKRCTKSLVFCRFLLIFISGLCCGGFLSSALAEQSQVMRVKHYDMGYTPSIRAFQRDLLHLLMQRTEAEYGPYELELYHQPLTSNRSKLVLQEGKKINVLFAPEWTGWGVDAGRVLELDLPIYKGLQGLRHLIVKADRFSDFLEIKNLADFKKLSAGQGASWLDAQVLRANGIVTEEGQNFDNLMPMLQKSRFDYLPLSILETDAVLKARDRQLMDVMLVDNLMIFYPLPSFLYLPSHEARLAERLVRGFSILKKNGDLDRLFQQHFYAVRDALAGKNKRLVILKNPALSEAKNNVVINDLLKEYGEHFTRLDE
jgi:hypothetical protein